MPFLIIEPHAADGTLQTAPYDPSDYGDWPSAGRNWLQRLGDAAISQRDLSLAWEAIDQSVPARPVSSAWLDGGPATMMDQVRTASPGVTVILKEDAQDVLSGRKQVTQVAIPMPPIRRSVLQSADKLYGFPIVSTNVIEYDSRKGASWRSA
jgi:hypothetical protein